MCGKKITDNQEKRVGMKQTSFTNFAKFAYELGQQLEVGRSGWRLIRAPKEPLGCHVARAAQIGYFLALSEGIDNPEKVATAILFHDVHECRGTDLDKITARYVEFDERRAIEEQVTPLGEIGEKIYALWKVVEERQGKEGIIAKDADYLEACVRARELMVQGFPEAADWIVNVGQALQTDSAKKLYAALLEVHPNDWWKGLKKLS
jgi:putative hydrolase of HD superfamily